MKLSAWSLRVEERFDFPASGPRRPHRPLGEESGPTLALLTLQRGVIDLLNLSPTFGSHKDSDECSVPSDNIEAKCVMNIHQVRASQWCFRHRLLVAPL